MSCDTCTGPSQALCVGVGNAPIWTIDCIDPDAAGASIDITGTTFEFVVKTAPDDADVGAIFSLTSAADEIVITDAANGQAQIINDAAKTALLTAGRNYHWSLRTTFASGEIRTTRRGTLAAFTA